MDPQSTAPADDLEPAKVTPAGNAPTDRPNQNYDGLRRERDDIALTRAKAAAVVAPLQDGDLTHQDVIVAAEHAALVAELDAREAIVDEHLSKVEPAIATPEDLPAADSVLVPAEDRHEDDGPEVTSDPTPEPAPTEEQEPAPTEEQEPAPTEAPDPAPTETGGES